MRCDITRFLILFMASHVRSDVHMLTNRYLAFLADWMWEAFGFAGLFFALAEIIATACRAVFWVQLWCGQHRRVRPLWKLQPSFPETQWPLVEVGYLTFERSTLNCATPSLRMRGLRCT